ncbi:uncharacterized protein LOC126797036 [Argentina anserina]|uniref:uncharacterized protein LOC126797036 n=1 Tax=Argentina anserina TaxID=57926 RepID=UPI002176688F|nr:uncharacterized protein LOC126797036 [Potentilla anserina]
MAADEVPLLNLFDSFWFQHAVFSSKPHAAAEGNPSLQLDQEDQISILQEPNPSGLPTLIVRSLSDQILDINQSLFSDSSVSPHSVLPTRSPKLQAIPSGKEVLTDFSRESVPVKQELEVGSAPLKKRVLHSERAKRRKSSGSSKSLSDLEFDELKGFMDLGFVFTEEDNKDSNLVAIIPGLQRHGVSEEVGKEDRDEEKSISDGSHHHSHVVSRPYLSEAWEALEYQRKENQLINWRVPSALDKDMKHHLKFWAHTVASTVR